MAKKQEQPQDAGQADMQQRADEAAEKGYYGQKVDPTPNENYTVAGVLDNAPTPETDAALEREGREAAGLAKGPLEAAEAAKEEKK